jgi:peptidoglycan/xylan/chitin deacetylase (PgdA/CDA1 family)
MRVVSPLLKRVVYPSLGKTGYLRHRSDSFLSVVTYHGVLPGGYQVRDQFLDATLVSLENFRAQLRLLKSDYDVISCADFRKWLTQKGDLPARAVLLTCDDGLLNNLTEMVPALREEGLECLFFVTGASASEQRTMLWHLELYLILMLSERKLVSLGFPGSELRMTLRDSRSRRLIWLRLIEKLSDFSDDKRRVFLDDAAAQCGLAPDWRRQYLAEPLRKRFGLLTRCELQQLCNAGMTIGAHSLTHPILKKQALAHAESEMVGSREALAEVTAPVWAFAYPFGDEASVSEREFLLAEKAGFDCAFVNTEGTLSASSHRYALPRFHVSRDMGVREFEAHITGFHSRLRRRFA